MLLPHNLLKRMRAQAVGQRPWRLPLHIRSLKQIRTHATEHSANKGQRRVLFRGRQQIPDHVKKRSHRFRYLWIADHHAAQRLHGRHNHHAIGIGFKRHVKRPFFVIKKTGVSSRWCIRHIFEKFIGRFRRYRAIPYAHLNPFINKTGLNIRIRFHDICA